MRSNIVQTLPIIPTKILLPIVVLENDSYIYSSHNVCQNSREYSDDRF